MTLRLYNPTGTSIHGDDIESASAVTPRTGEWVRFHEVDPVGGTGIYRIVSVEHVLHGCDTSIFVTAYEVSDEEFERAKLATHDENLNYRG